MKNNFKMNNMLKEIEKARKHMINLAFENSLTSQEVINASTKLDKLLNALNRSH